MILLRPFFRPLLAIYLTSLAIARSEASTAWPNEPSGYTTITDWNFNAFTGSGWRGGGSSIKDDPTATSALSPSKVGEWSYPVGFTGDGVSPGIMAFDLPAAFGKEGYIGFWWKPSAPWQGHPSYVNKISFIFGDIGHIILMMYGPPGGPYQLQVAPEWGNWNHLWPNKSSGLVTLGQWQHVELQFIQRPIGGVIRWWLNSQLVGEYTDVAFPGINFQEFQFSPTWGGRCVPDCPKTENDYYRFDHAYISAPGAGSADATAPASPRGLGVK